MALYELAENCEYGAMHEEVIRDRLVVGIRDNALSEKLQMDSIYAHYSLQQFARERQSTSSNERSRRATKRRARAASTLFARQTLVNEDAAVSDTKPRIAPDNDHVANGQTRGKCGRCGRELYLRDECPARDAQCFNCKRKGHYSDQCRQKTASTVQEEDSTINSAFLDTVSNGKTKVWMTNITTDGKQIPFKLDTGAEVTAITEEPWEMLYRETSTPDTHCGHFLCHLAQQVYVVDHLLLGLPAIMDLHLAVRMDTLQTPILNIKEKFPSVFQGLGTLAGEYQIRLHPDAQPQALFTARHVPLPLRPKVAEELERMEQAGVISKVSVPTPWWSSRKSQDWASIVGCW